MPKQPSSKDCFVCGVQNSFGLKIKFYEDEPGVVTADIIIPDHYQGYPGVAHGGIVTAVLDEAAGRSHMGGSPPRFLYTARIDVRFRKTTPVGKPLRLVGKAGESKRRTAAASAALYDEDGELLAEAEAVMVDIPESITEGVDLDELGWKVYPD